MKSGTEKNEDLIRRYVRSGDAKALHALVEQNSALVGKLARPLSCYVPLEDLLQAGKLGLVRAVAKFDHRRDVKFITYAAFWIRAEMLALVAGTRVARATTKGQRCAARRAHRVTARRAAVGLPTDDASIAADLGVKEADVAASHARAVDLDQAKNASDPGPSIEDVLVEREQIVGWRALVEAFRATLRGRDRLIFDARAPRVGQERATLASVGARVGVSRERIRQVEEELIGRLRLLARRLEAA